MSAPLANEVADLPGADLILEGLEDLSSGRETAGSLLIAIGHPRLSRLGIAGEWSNRLPRDPERRLYRLLGAIHGNEAHSQYNALIRRLISFERALEHRQAAKKRPG